MSDQGRTVEAGTYGRGPRGWLAMRLHSWAGRLDPALDFRSMSTLALTLEEGRGWVLNHDGRGVPIWYRHPEYDKAWATRQSADCAGWYWQGREPQEECPCGHVAASHALGRCYRCNPGATPERDAEPHANDVAHRAQVASRWTCDTPDGG